MALINEIENRVAARQSATAHEKISRFLRKAGKREAVFQACDWYRRLGLHERGYRLLSLDEPIQSRASTRTFEGQRTLWAARFLNLMGATEFAIALLAHVEPESSDDHRIVGTLYLAHFDHRLAARHFERMNALDPDPARYVSRLARINWSDALAGLGDSDGAVRQAEKVFEASSEPLLRGISLQAQGEYLARAGRYELASERLKRAQPFFPGGDRTVDMALLLKWLAYAEAKNGRIDEARARFAAAYDILRGTGLRAEAWMDVLRLMDDAGLLPAEDRARMARYPGLVPGFRALLRAPSPRAAGAEAREGVEATSSRRWLIDLARGETTRGGAHRLGVSTEIRALAYVALAGPWGLPLVRLKSLLWPDEVHAFLYLGNRLQQIFLRLRREHAVRIEVSGGVVRLGGDGPGGTDGVEAVEVVSEGSPHPSFFSGRAGFTRSEVESYYGLSQTQAWAALRGWKSRGWIREERRGMRTSYLIVV